MAQQSSSAKAKPADDTGADSPHQNPVRSNQTTEVTAKTLPRGTAKTLPRGTLAANRMQAQAHSASMPAVEPRDADASTTEQAPGGEFAVAIATAIWSLSSFSHGLLTRICICIGRCPDHWGKHVFVSSGYTGPGAAVTMSNKDVQSFDFRPSILIPNLGWL